MKKIIIITIFLIASIWCYGQGDSRTNFFTDTVSLGDTKHGLGIYKLDIDMIRRIIGFYQDTTCVKDTAEAYLQIQACDSCKVRLRIGFVVADKCSPIGNPETVEYINVSFLDIKRIPLPERATVIKYTRKN